MYSSDISREIHKKPKNLEGHRNCFSTFSHHIIQYGKYHQRKIKSTIHKQLELISIYSRLTV